MRRPVTPLGRDYLTRSFAPEEIELFVINQGILLNWNVFFVSYTGRRSDR